MARPSAGVLSDGGVLFQGTRPGVSREAFELALVDHTSAATLNRLPQRQGRDGARLRRARCTPWAKVACSTRFSNIRHHLPRVGLGPHGPGLGPPRPLHVAESLRDHRFLLHSASARYGRPGAPIPQARIASRAHWSPVPTFAVEQFLISAGSALRPVTPDTCAVVTCIDGRGVLATDGGALPLVLSEHRLAARGLRVAGRRAATRPRSFTGRHAPILTRISWGAIQCVRTRGDSRRCFGATGCRRWWVGIQWSACWAARSVWPSACVC